MSKLILLLDMLPEEIDSLNLVYADPIEYREITNLMFYPEIIGTDRYTLDHEHALKRGDNNETK